MTIFAYDGAAARFATSNFEALVGNAIKFRQYTGKERDSESGLDYFGARYYGSALGRFTSPDWSEKPEPVPYADLENPQTLNLYTYGRNNPLSQHNPDGHRPCTVDGETHGGVWCFFHSIGFVETQHEQANDLRNFYQGVSYTGSDGKPVEVSQLSDAQIIQFNKDHRIGLATSNWSIPGVAAVVPKSALDTLQSVETTGKNLPNQRGGQTCENRDSKLPTQDANGNPIAYKEWDTGASKFQGKPAMTRE